MSASPDGTVFQANFKIGADLFNVYATNGAEFADLLDAFQDHLSKIAAIQSAIGAVHTVATTVPVAPAARQPAPQAPAGVTDSDAAHLCDCGLPMKMIPAGVSKATGKPYRAFMACAQPRETQCNKKISL